MGADESRDVYRAILVPDPRATFENMDLTTDPPSQAGPLPGIPEDTSDTPSQMTLRSSGEQSAEGALRLHIARGGFPGSRPAASGPSFVRQLGAGFLWKQNGDAQWRGRDLPSVITGFDQVIGTSSSYGYRYPQAVTLRSGKVLVAYCFGSSSTRYVYLAIRDTDGSWSTNNLIYSEDNAGSGSSGAWLCPCLVVLPPRQGSSVERVLLLHWTYWVPSGGGGGTPGEAQVIGHYSDDEGQTWTQYSPGLLDEPMTWFNYYSDHAPLRAAYSGGGIALFGTFFTGSQHETYQWASSDHGTSFGLVRNWYSDNVDEAACPAVVALPSGGFLLAVRETTGGSVYTGRMASAYEPITIADMDELDLISGDMEADISLVMADDRAVYVFYREEYDVSTNPTPAAKVAWTKDEGLNWSVPQTYLAGANSWFWASEERHVPAFFTTTWHRGRVLMVCNWDSDSASYPWGLYEIALGGYTDVTMPRSRARPEDRFQAIWTHTWLPIDEPDDLGASRTAVGTVSDFISGSGRYYRVTTDAGETLKQTWFFSSTIEDGVIVKARCNPVTGDTEILGAYTDASFMQGYEFQIVVASSSIDVTDSYDARPLGSDTSAFTGEVEVLAVSANGKLSVWWRDVSGNPLDEDRQWTQVIENITLSDNMAFTQPQVSMYTPESSQSYWFELHYSAGDHTGLANGYDLASGGWPGTSELYPAPLSRNAVYVDDGVRIAAVDGPCMAGETWSINARYTYGVENLDPRISPSPRVPWRTEDTSAVNLYWNYADANTRYGSTSVGWYFAAGNSRRYYIYGLLAGGGSSLIDGVDAAAGQVSMAFVRKGDVLVPDSGGTNATRWWAHNAMKDGTVDLGSGKLRRIAGNTAGLWTDASDIQTPEIRLADLDGTEPTSGLMTVWPSHVLHVRHNLTTDYIGFRVYMDSDTAEGYRELGNVVFGPVYVFPLEYSWGRSLELEPNVDLSTRRGGSRSSRVLGPERRSVEFGWKEGVDTTATQGDSPDPAFVKGTSAGGPIGTIADTPALVAGLVEQLRGSHTPIVYIPRLEDDSIVTLRQRDDFLYGRVVSGVRREVPVGDENESEVQRIASIRIEEEL